MAKPIKCTYSDCYQRFDTVDVMRKHKAKDAAHDFYCKRCDEDCTDDVKYLLHQIRSSKHIACPLCGTEFKSQSGRDRHVNVEHPAKQNINCPGCHARFDSAAGLMGHIEKNQCMFIGAADFHKHQAEQQIVKDAMSDLTDSFSGISVRPSESYEFAESNSGGNVLESERVSAFPVDWEGNTISDFTIESTAPGNEQTTSNRGAANELDRYLTLPATTRTTSTNASHDSVDPNVDLLDVQQQPQIRRPAQPQGAWANGSLPASSKQPSSVSSYINVDDPLKQNDASSDLLGSTIHPANAWQSFQKQNVARSELRRTAASSVGAVATSESNTGRSILISARSGNENVDPYAHIQVQARVRLRTQFDLQKYWNPIEQVYICPGARCGKSLRSQNDFEDHLLHEAHSRDTVRCPSCFKKFKTTTALLSHIESGSIKCRVREAADIDQVLREVTAGMVAVKGFGEDGRLQYKSMPVEEW